MRRDVEVVPLKRILLAVALAIWVLAPGAAFGQDPARELGDRRENIPLERAGTEGRFDLHGFVSWLAPVSDLTNDPEAFATIVNPSVGFGLDGNYWIPNSQFGIGLQGVYTRTELDVRETDFQGTIPDDLGNVDYFNANATFIYRVPVSGPASAVQPFFAAGGGVRYLGVEEIASPDVESSWDPMGTLAGGILVRITGGLDIRSDLRYFISRYKSPSTGESKIQNDFLIVVGLGWRFY